MTFPFSTHNYHLRFWMAAGGVDPDEDVRLVVLPPPYMVESLANRHVDGFCVGAPWNSVAVDLGIGFILHFVSEILPRAAEKVLAVRARWAQENPDVLLRLVRAHGRAAAFVEDAANRDEVAAHARRARPHRRRARGDPPHARRPHEGRARRHRAGRATAISWSAATAPRGPTRRRRPGSMRRWCAGGRRRCRPNCWPPPRRCSVPTSTTRRSPARSPRCAGRAGRRHRRVRRTGLRPRRHRRPSRRLAIRRRAEPMLFGFCTAQNFCSMVCDCGQSAPVAAPAHATAREGAICLIYDDLSSRRSWHEACKADAEHAPSALTATQGPMTDRTSNAAAWGDAFERLGLRLFFWSTARAGTRTAANQRHRCREDDERK